MYITLDLIQFPFDALAATEQARANPDVRRSNRMDSFHPGFQVPDSSEDTKRAGDKNVQSIPLHLGVGEIWAGDPEERGPRATWKTLKDGIPHQVARVWNPYAAIAEGRSVEGLGGGVRDSEQSQFDQVSRSTASMTWILSTGQTPSQDKSSK